MCLRAPDWKTRLGEMSPASLASPGSPASQRSLDQNKIPFDSLDLQDLQDSPDFKLYGVNLEYFEVFKPQGFN